jgi:[protein-PII] uridylyltransferase
LASRLGYHDTDAQLGVEQFMHDYYHHVLALREVNDILLQHFDEAILRAHYAPEIEPINERFQIRDNYIETRSNDVFRRHPAALIEMFVIMANRRDIQACARQPFVGAQQSRSHRRGFRNDPEVTGRSSICCARRTRWCRIDAHAPDACCAVHTGVRRDRPDAARPVHIYTVDAHTMMVIRNMRLHYRSSQDTFPALHRIKNLPKIELLYIAGLFHDIAKGRGGDH